MPMKSSLFMLLAAFGWATVAQAQSADTTKDQTIAGKMARFWKQVKDEVSYTADGLFSKEGNYKVLVDGNYYMPVYDVNLYKGTDGREMRNECGTQLLRKYPSAEIVSCVIPQTDWLTTTEEQGGQVVSYKQTLYCYVLAKDGAEGYINQRYVFVRSRKPGEDFVNDTQCWAKLQGTDVMAGKVFDKLTSKNKKKKK